MSVYSLWAWAALRSSSVFSCSWGHRELPEFCRGAELPRGWALCWHHTEQLWLQA